MKMMEKVEKAIQQISRHTACPSCKSVYGKNDIHYLGSMGEAEFFHLRCPKCSLPVFVNIQMTDVEIIKESKQARVKMGGTFNDVRGKEKLVNDCPQRVTHDDVIDVHKHISDHGINFGSI